MTYIDPYMTMVMTVTEMYAAMTVVCHYHQYMTITLTASVIKTKCCHHNDLDITANDAAPCRKCVILHACKYCLKAKKCAKCRSVQKR